MFLLAVHAVTWTLLLCCGLSMYGPVAAWKPLLLVTTHALSDKWKWGYPQEPKYFWTMYVDQTIHFASILVVLP